METPSLLSKKKLSDDEIRSILESVLFMSETSQSVSSMKSIFQQTDVTTAKIKKCLEQIKEDYEKKDRGIFLAEVAGGYQLRTKKENVEFLKGGLKPKKVYLSRSALEILAVLAYKQPCTRSQIDEIRGVHSGNTLRTLIDKGLAQFAGKSDEVGKPVVYKTTKKFLEVFSLSSLKDLPPLSEIDQLIPDNEISSDSSLEDISESLEGSAEAFEEVKEKELEEIAGELSQISTSTAFFEEEKDREKKQKEEKKAAGIREALEKNEDVSDFDKRWLERFESKRKD